MIRITTFRCCSAMSNSTMATGSVTAQNTRSTAHQLLSQVMRRCFSASAPAIEDDHDDCKDDETFASSSSFVSSAASELLLLPVTSQPLGVPLPFDEHACSVSLPTWSSVVGYEEGDKEVTTAMTCGYPRFVYHPYVLQLMQIILQRFGSHKNEEDCLVLPTKEAAQRCQAFLEQSLEDSRTIMDNASLGRPDSHDPTSTIQHQQDPPSRIRMVVLDVDEETDADNDATVYAVLFPAQTAVGIEAKAYWQHTGELVSSRRAEVALQALQQDVDTRITCCPAKGIPTIFHSSDSRSSDSSDECSVGNNVATMDDPHQQLREQIASWTQVTPDNVFLLPSGMATMYKAMRSARRFQLTKAPKSKGGTSIVFGFPYLDTLKMCSRTEFSPAGVEFFGKGDDVDLQNLEHLLANKSNKPNQTWSGIFTEVPSNPLLQCPDLGRLRELADEHDLCMIVDDTIGNFLNVDLIESGLADAVCTSLTKLVSGRGDAMAGSVVTNPNTEKGRWMREDMAKDTDSNGGLHEADARAMVHNSQDFPERNTQINETSERLADFLHDHPDVEKVWYPKFVAPLFANYQKQGPGSGFGGVMSMHLHPHICQRTFYDALDVAKGPSLGTNFTLVCPYTLLAHYHELDFALSYNVPPNLIRIAVGLEDYDDLEDKFAYALNKARLHPKIDLTVLSA